MQSIIKGGFDYNSIIKTLPTEIHAKIVSNAIFESPVPSDSISQQNMVYNIYVIKASRKRLKGKRLLKKLKYF